MDAIPSLPPYAHIDKEAVQCVALASARYEVPELLMHAILMKENGRMGKCSKNKNGTYDCGLAQINTAWTSYFAKQGVRSEHLLGDACTNIHASAYILRSNYNLKNADWFKAAIAYNIGPNNWSQTRYAIGYKYARDVVGKWWGFQNWVDAKNGIVRDPNTAKVVRSAERPEGPTALVFEAPRMDGGTSN